MKRLQSLVKLGAGKTTITKILMRLYPINKGKVTIDGYDLNELSIKSIRNNITYISQDSYIFKDTVRKNIVLERNDISDKQILDVMEQIGAIPLLERLDNGLDEVVDINRLSKGELQVIAFIRAIVHKANIYIFDEPTRGIDVGARDEIYNIMYDLIAKGASIIMISSDLVEVLKMSDRVVVMREGRINGIVENDGMLTQEETMKMELAEEEKHEG